MCIAPTIKKPLNGNHKCTISMGTSANRSCCVFQQERTDYLLTKFLECFHLLLSSLFIFGKLEKPDTVFSNFCTTNIQLRK